jgi:hypothetical protein
MALLRLYAGSIKALCKLYEGSMKALLLSIKVGVDLVYDTPTLGMKYTRLKAL